MNDFVRGTCRWCGLPITGAVYPDRHGRPTVVSWSHDNRPPQGSYWCDPARRSSDSIAAPGAEPLEVAAT